jgi:hypothetical protein
MQQALDKPARLLLLLALFCGGAQASMRCNGGIIEEGDMTTEVIQKCGQPANRQATAPALDAYGRVIKGAVSVENWVYGPDNGMFRYLRFIDGKLVEIRSQR